MLEIIEDGAAFRLREDSSLPLMQRHQIERKSHKVGRELPVHALPCTGWCGRAFCAQTATLAL